ncbi:hypothetical protein L1987_03368 [Smallanthus sonchifolius]|uniref:Uncharacterized protein n=1 Tax=Smallanthus sonchifolius TaxID=185202 RepID=A0ACB9KAP5_9ASTR|nr:hypothetical protein L1987_03368 [Smallanthus sonchifolius]
MELHRSFNLYLEKANLILDITLQLPQLRQRKKERPQIPLSSGDRTSREIAIAIAIAIAIELQLGFTLLKLSD